MDWNLWKRSFKKNDITQYDDNKQQNFEIGKSRILCDLDQLLKMQH